MMNRRVPNRSSKYRGFTLIELLIVMLIGSIVILGIRAAYRQSYLIWSSVENRRPIYHNARLITETLRQELSCLYMPAAPDANVPDANSRALRPIVVDTTELVFFTLAPSWRGSVGSSRIARVRYSFTKDDYTDEPVLQRFEQPYAGEEPIAKETSDIVAKGLSDFNASIVGGQDNDGQWNDRPPEALRISLTWAGTDDVPEIVFQTTIQVPCQATLEPAGSDRASQPEPPPPPF